MTRSLFHIGDDLEAFDQLSAEVEDDRSRWGEPDAILVAWFDSLADEQATKLECYRLYISRLQGEAATARQQAADFAVMAQRRESKIERLKAHLKAYMEHHGQTKLLTSTGRSFSIQANGGLLPLRIEGDVPPEYTVTKTEPNNDMIRNVLAQGIPLPFAKLGERGTSLRIR